RMTVQEVDPEVDLVSSDPAATSQRRPDQGAARDAPAEEATRTALRPAACLHRIPYRGICHEPTTRQVIALGAGVSDANTLRPSVGSTARASRSPQRAEDRHTAGDGTAVNWRKRGAHRGVADRRARYLAQR